MCRSDKSTNIEILPVSTMLHQGVPVRSSPELVFNSGDKMTFAKLDSGITMSSIWSEPLHVRVVWVAFLSLKDENGLVCGVRSSLQRACNVTMDQYDDAVKILSSPDPESKTKDFEGRRISKCDDGWIILNHEKYRLHDDIQREKTRERVRKHREKINNVTQCNVTDTLPSVSVSVSVSDSVSKSLEECRETFLKDVNSYTQYPEKMRIDFIDYWTEKNQSGKKMRYQMEKTWDTHKRLARWANNNKTFNQQQNLFKQPEQSSPYRRV